MAEKNKDYLKLKGVSKLGYSLLQNELESNLKVYLDWALLSVGGWTDVRIPTSGAYGGNFHTLHYIADPAYTDGQVWETPRTDLVYESGVNFEGSGNPISISGVYVDGVFKTPSDATYAHYVDYPNGRVVFTNAVDTTKTITMEYSYRDIQVQIADESPMWKHLQYDSLRVDDSHLTDSTSGEWTAQPSISRRQMPTIVIEAVSRGSSRPYEIGNGSMYKYRDILFHCVAEDRFWRNQLIDIIDFLADKSIYMYNTNEVAESGAFPLNYNGSINSDGVCYNTLVNRREENGYRWRELRFREMRMFEAENKNPRLFTGVVRANIEVIYGDI